MHQKRDIEPKKTKDATDQQPDSQQQQLSQENNDIHSDFLQQQPQQQMEVEEEKNTLQAIRMDGMPLDEAIIHSIEKCSTF